MLSATPVAFGLGDGHGGNFMVTEAGAEGPMLFFDYAMAGFHSPILDLAKAIYVDAFFEILYADQLMKNKQDGDFGIMWRGSSGPGPEESPTLNIETRFRVGSLSEPIALVKLECLLKPTLRLMAPHGDAAQIEKALGHALLVCALLTRRFNQHQAAFLLSLAVGVRLASDRRRVFYEMFGWQG